MHAPLPRSSLPRRMRDEDSWYGTLALARACATVVMLSVTLVGLVAIIGELSAAAPNMRRATTSPANLAARVLPQVAASNTLFD